MRLHTCASPAPIALDPWRHEVLAALDSGLRPVTLYGQHPARVQTEEEDSAPRGRADLLLTAILQRPDGTLLPLRTRVTRADEYRSLTSAGPPTGRGTAGHIALQGFEREIHEQFGLPMPGHPWLKPVRFEGGPGQIAMNEYPWYRIEGKDVHEVAVGPIHAGVIEPGSFRFACNGERVLHLEIQLGYQHRGVETLLPDTPVSKLLPLVETISGDTSTAYAWAASAALEALAGVENAATTDLSRAILLELERIATHLVGRSGMAADIGHLQGSSTYGRLRTTVINTSMRLCGSRFGRTGVRPGGPAYTLDVAGRDALNSALNRVAHDLVSIDEHFQADWTVRHRLDGIGVVDTTTAEQIGMVGPPARASGIPLDQRVGSPLYDGLTAQVEPSGDCWARARVRIREMQQSIAWLRKVLATHPEWERPRHTTGAELTLAPNNLAICMVEGWRGEVLHAIETDTAGKIARYKVQDPSFRNWLGLAMAVRGGQISDFPICNKSFDLSYCGHDL